MRDFDDEELAAVRWFRRGEVEVERGTQIQRQLEPSGQLYTLYEGFAFRHVELPDGRRQILNLLFPGDLIGLQASLFERSEHSVEALTDVRLCLFEKERLPELFARTPEMAYDVIWITANEQRFLDLNLVALGRYRGDERIAYLILYFVERMRAASQMIDEGDCQFPLRLQHIADALGLSVPYTSRTLKRLAQEGVCEIRRGRLRILDRDRLKERAVAEVQLPARIPFI